MTLFNTRYIKGDIDVAAITGDGEMRQVWLLPSSWLVIFLCNVDHRVLNQNWAT